MATIARMLLVGSFAALALVLAGQAAPTQRPAPPPAPSGKVVYLAGALSDEALVALGALAASRPDATLLLDSQPLRPYLKHFLSQAKPPQVVAVGKFSEDR